MTRAQTIAALVVTASMITKSTLGYSQEVKSVFLSEKSVAAVAISMRGTVLSFPSKPSKVILGNDGAFGIEYVENDIAITPLTQAARANLFVYLLGQRFTFDLRASPVGHAIVVVRDAIDEAPEKMRGPNGRHQHKK